MSFYEILYTSSFNIYMWYDLIGIKTHQKLYLPLPPACRTTWNSTMTGSWSELQTPQGALSAFSHQHWSVTLFNQLLSPNSQLSGLEEKNSNSDGSRGKVNLPFCGTALERARVPVWVATPRKAREGLSLWEGRRNFGEEGRPRKGREEALNQYKLSAFISPSRTAAKMLHEWLNYWLQYSCIKAF